MQPAGQAKGNNGAGFQIPSTIVKVETKFCTDVSYHFHKTFSHFLSLILIHITSLTSAHSQAHLHTETHTQTPLQMINPHIKRSFTFMQT